MATKNNNPFRSVLITGISGLVGSTVFRMIQGLADEITGIYHHLPFKEPGLTRCLSQNLTDLNSLERLLADIKPSLVINCAACSDIAPCEADPVTALRINAEVPECIARFCNNQGARLIHLSTDLVFDGRQGVYVESDPVRPVHEYGRSKAKGEQAVASANPEALTMRIALVYGRSYSGQRSASEKFLADIKAGREIRLFTNEWRCPVLVDDVAQAVLFFGKNDVYGIIHVAGRDRVNRLDIGRAMAKHFGLDDKLLVPALSQGLNAVPPRPLDLSLNINLASSLLPFKLKGLAQGLATL